MASRRQRLAQRRRWWWRVGLGSVAVLLISAAGFIYWVFAGSLPTLDGKRVLAGLQDDVEISRDIAGVPVLRGRNRVDLARTLGFLHGQERYFQMDLLRRAGAGELSALLGRATLDIDKIRRRHRFRVRAEAVLAAMAPDQRALLDAYVAGVNDGLAALDRPPFEYALLRQTPLPWQAVDSLLVAYALYFELEENDGWTEQRRALVHQALGPSLAAFLYPPGNANEAPLDGIMLPDPPLPVRPSDGTRASPSAPLAPPTPSAPSASPDPSAPSSLPAPAKGSNAFAVAGSLTATGAAIVANDEHLGLRMPNIWYRARLIENSATPLDITGTTLPGIPFVIAGSNTHIAWGFTNSYISTGDAILLDPAPDNDAGYLTPEGPKPLQTVVDQICVAGAPCQDFPIEETVWGPVVGRDASGRRIVWHWLAHDANAVGLEAQAELERAHSTREALDIAHRLALPDQNFIVGDADGHIAWSVAGLVPRRIGLDDGEPHSWADGASGWQGYLAPEEVPEIVDPPSGRIWSANNRMVGGAALALLGDGGYDEGDRARQIRDDLTAKTHFSEADLLAIQLDDRAVALTPWRKLLQAALGTKPAASEPALAAMLPYVANWGGKAEPDSIGYRLVRGFQSLAVNLVYAGLAPPVEQAAPPPGRPMVPSSGTSVALRLLTERPADLVPKPYRSWDDFTLAVLKRLGAAVDDGAGGDLSRFSWGRRNHLGIHHPLSLAVPLLGRLTDPPDVPIAGDDMMPRVVTPGFGASERFVVSPGHEADGIFEMPGGQAGDPLSPYYLAGHEDWVLGKPAPFLPGAERWRLVLEPG
jgi:penicillin G amidase